MNILKKIKNEKLEIKFMGILKNVCNICLRYLDKRVIFL